MVVLLLWFLFIHPLFFTFPHHTTRTTTPPHHNHPTPPPQPHQIKPLNHATLHHTTTHHNHTTLHHTTTHQNHTTLPPITTTPHHTSLTEYVGFIERVMQQMREPQYQRVRRIDALMQQLDPADQLPEEGTLFRGVIDGF